MDDKESVLSISNCKFSTNGEQYFSIFDKHIPCGLTGNIMLFGIGNPYTADLICSKNPAARYVVVDEESLGSFYPMILNQDYSISILNNANLNEFPNTDMKFDCIIMNPPYQRNLHLKILAEAIKHLKDDDSKVVNLSPVLWIENPFAQMRKQSNYNKFKDKIAEKIESLDVIPVEKADKAFGIHLFSRLGVYMCSNKDNDFNHSEFWKNNYSKEEISIFEKISNKVAPLNSHIEKNKIDGIRVLLTDIAGNRGTLPIYKEISYVIDGKKNGKCWTKCKNNGGYVKKEGSPIPNSIKFNTINEAENFYNSCKTNFYKFICKRFTLDQHIPVDWLPWMGEQINPRTGKKGYKSDWIDEDFCKFFDITDEEFEEITKQIDTLDKAKK